MIDWCFLMENSFSEFQNIVLPQDFLKCSSALDLMAKMFWTGRTGSKGVKLFYNLSDFFLTGFAPPPGAKTIELKTALGSCSNVFIFDVFPSKDDISGCVF